MSQQSELERMSTPPLRPEPKDGGIPAGQRGEADMEDIDEDDIDINGDDVGIGTEDLPGSNTDTQRRATRDIDGDDEDAPDANNPNIYGEDES